MAILQVLNEHPQRLRQFAETVSKCWMGISLKAGHMSRQDQQECSLFPVGKLVAVAGPFKSTRGYPSVDLEGQRAELPMFEEEFGQKQPKLENQTFQVCPLLHSVLQAHSKN